MCNILWDFDGTLAYRDGMWSAALLSLLNKNGINNVSIEKIKLIINGIVKTYETLWKNRGNTILCVLCASVRDLKKDIVSSE